MTTSTLTAELVSFEPENGDSLGLCRRLAQGAGLQWEPTGGSVQQKPISATLYAAQFSSSKNAEAALPHGPWRNLGRQPAEDLCRSILQDAEAEKAMHRWILYSNGSDQDPLCYLLTLLWWDSTQHNRSHPRNPTVGDTDAGHHADSPGATCRKSEIRALIISLLPTVLWTFLSRCHLNSAPERLHSCHKNQANPARNSVELAPEDSFLGLEAVLLSCCQLFECIPRTIRIVDIRRVSSVLHDSFSIPAAADDIRATYTSDKEGERDRDSHGSDVDGDGEYSDASHPSQINKLSRQLSNSVKQPLSSRFKLRGQKDGYKEVLQRAKKMTESLKLDVALSETFPKDESILGQGTQATPENLLSSLTVTSRARCDPNLCPPIISITERAHNACIIQLMAVYHAHCSVVSPLSALLLSKCVRSLVMCDFAPMAPTDVAQNSLQCHQPNSNFEACEVEGQVFYDSNRVRISLDDEVLIDACRTVAACIELHGYPNSTHTLQINATAARSRSEHGTSDTTGAITSQKAVYASSVETMIAALKRAELDGLVQATFYILTILNLLNVTGQKPD